MGLTIKMPPIHAGQRQLLECPTRHIIARCGRRWGKTRFAAMLVVFYLAQQKSVLWVAPCYSQCDIGKSLVWQLSRQFGAKMQKAKNTIAFGVGKVRFMSGDDPDKLRGDSCDLLVMDEAAYMPKEVWTTLRPSLADRKGRLLAISTPNGATWMSDLENQPDFATFHFATSSNPYIEQKEIDAMRKDLPPKLASQELDAELVNMTGSVFAPLIHCERQNHPSPDGSYVMAVDVGQKQDSTVITIMDVAKRAIVDLQSNQLPYDAQTSTIKGLANLWHPTALVVETNGIGQALYDNLNSAGLSVVPFITTNPSKVALVNGWLKNPPAIIKDDEVIRQFNAFSCNKNPSGAYVYGGTCGVHDDIVMSALICNWASESATEKWSV